VYGRAFYENVADAVTNFLPPAYRDFHRYSTAANLKLWYGDNGREHYEVQIVKRGKVLGLEIGFHAEHRDVAANDVVLARLVKTEKQWRKTLGKDPEVGAFIGHLGKTWRRVSEVWEDSLTDGSETAVDAAERLATYITVLEPLRKTQ
jgi:hypothetical protein